MSFFLLFRPRGVTTIIESDTHDDWIKRRNKKSRSTEEHVRDIVRTALFERHELPAVIEATRKAKNTKEKMPLLQSEYLNTLAAATYLQHMTHAEKERGEALIALAKRQAELEMEIMKLEADDDEFLLLCLLH